MKFKRWKYKVTCDGVYWTAWYRRPFHFIWTPIDLYYNVDKREQAEKYCQWHAKTRLDDFQRDVKRQEKRASISLGWLP